MREYFRLTKPGIIYANVMTAAAGFLFASKDNIDFWLLISLLVGNSLVIASACAFNNYIDRGIDKKMARTKNRALVSGKIPPKNALIFASVLGLVGFSLLAAYTNSLVLIIGAIAFIDYIVLYGITKRRSSFGTHVGTIAGASSIAAGYLAVANHIDAAVILLFLIMVFWQMPHFFAIAIFRLKDYKAAGIPVLPAKKGIYTTKLQILFYISLFIISSALLTIFGYSGYTYFVLILLIGCYWLYKGIDGFKMVDDTKWARGMFGFSLVVLLIFCVILSIENILP